jgi:methylated-DNA-[protein]-cysteine S-methyltransferase
MYLTQLTPSVIYSSSVGRVAVYDNGTAVIGVILRYQGSGPASPSTLSERIQTQLQQYFDGERQNFTLPLAPQGTPFQLRLWQQLCLIPHGQVRRYGELAAILGSSARAVGGACRRNPIPLMIPCHRVVSATGLGGFSGQRAGEWLAIKQQLLDIEQSGGKQLAAC